MCAIHAGSRPAPPSYDAAWETEAETLTLRVSSCAFDGGGERNVFHAQFDGSGFEWVAKESKHVITDDDDEDGFVAEVRPAAASLPAPFIGERHSVAVASARTFS